MPKRIGREFYFPILLFSSTPATPPLSLINNSNKYFLYFLFDKTIYL